MQYVVCYDIADDGRRNRAASCLLDFGTRIQEGVFVANLDDHLAERMRERLAKLVSEAEDRVYVFRFVPPASRGPGRWAKASWWRTGSFKLSDLQAGAIGPRTGEGVAMGEFAQRPEKKKFVRVFGLSAVDSLGIEDQFFDVGRKEYSKRLNL